MKQSNKTPGSRSLTRDFAIGFLVVLVALSITIFTISGMIFDRIESSKFMDEAHIAYDRFKSLIATPLWHYDDSGIESICTTFLSGSVAQRILLFSEDGKQLYAFVDAAEQMPSGKAFTDDLELNGKPIGSVEFYLKKPKYSEYAKFYFYTTTSAISLICISSTIAIWWLLRLYVNRPFSQLNAWMSKTEKGDYTGAILNFPQMEVQAVVKQFSKMVDGIRNREQDLKNSERRLADIINFLPDATFVIDTQGKVVAWNRSIEEMSGVKAEDMVGKGDYEYALPFYGARRPTLIDLALDWDENIAKAYVYVNKKGEILTSETMNPSFRPEPSLFWNSARVLHNADGEVIGAIEVIRDITDRMLAEKALKASEKRYRSIVEDQTEFIIRWLPDGTITYANKAYCNYFGLDADQCIGLNSFSLIAEEDRSAFRKKIESLKPSHADATDEHRVARSDGRIDWIQMVDRAFFDDEGQLVEYQSVGRDVTARKQVEEELQKSEAKLRAIFDQTFQFMGLLSTEGTVLKANRTALEFAGIDETAVIGKPFWQTAWWTHSPEEQAKVRQAVEKAATGEFVRFEATNSSRSETIRTVDFSLKPILDDDGSVIYLNPEARDITDRKQAEEAAKTLEAQLHQAQKMEAIGTLAGGIAHDFNNILSGIIGFTEISIRDVPPGSKLEENLQRVLNAGMRAADLVKQILAFSRQSDRVAKPVQVKSIAKEALKLMRASLPATIDIHQEVESESLIMADPIQVHQIIMNLCTNAGHAMQVTGGRMVVRLTDVETGAEVVDPDTQMAPGRYLKLAVSDSGPGIPPEIKDRIFDPFFTTKKIGEGTGLGLSMVHGIVKDCGGTVSVDSTPGEGSTFNLYFPVIESVPSADIVTRAPLPTGTERILFVDDEPSQVEMGKQVLEFLGYRVTTRTESTAALNVFREMPDAFDLVITDMTMPKMTGDALVKAMMHIRSDVPVILCTGYSEMITAAEAKAMGIKEMIMKPTVVEEIATTVRRVLDQA